MRAEWLAASRRLAADRPLRLQPNLGPWSFASCGSGRLARFVAPRVGRLHCIDPSSALAVAQSTLADQPNVQFHQASVAASGLLPRPKQLVTDLIALTVYWPLSRLASLAKAAGLPVASFPLSYYQHCSIYTLRTDARDRFGTPLEQRFSRAQICAMCSAAGLVDLRFSPRAPYWCVVGVKANYDD